MTGYWRQLIPYKFAHFQFILNIFTSQVQIDASQLTTSHTEVLCTDSEAASAIMGVQSGDWISGLRGARYHNNGKYIIGTFPCFMLSTDHYCLC